MRSFFMTAFSALLALIPLAGLPVTPACRAVPATLSSAALASRRIARLVRNYSLVTTIHFVATAKGRMVVTPQMARYTKSGVIEKRYEFWGKGKLYRISFAFAHPRAFSSEDFQAAYNGHSYQYLVSAIGALSVSSLPPKRNTMLPESLNPLVAPLVFLDPQPSSPAHRPVSFWDAAGKPQSVLAKLRVLSARRVGHDGLNATIAGGALRGKRTYYHVFFKQSPPRFLPDRVRLTTRSGTKLLSYTFSKYKMVRRGKVKIYLPEIYRTAMYGHRGAKVAAERTKIDFGAVNRPLRPNVFTINYKLAKSIFDNGAQVQMLPGATAYPKKIRYGNSR